MSSIQRIKPYRSSKLGFASILGRENIGLGVSMTVSMVILAGVLGSSP